MCNTCTDSECVFCRPCTSCDGKKCYSCKEGYVLE